MRFSSVSWGFHPHTVCFGYKLWGVLLENGGLLSQGITIVGFTKGHLGAGDCLWKSEWNICCFTWATDGQWWIEDDKYTEGHSSRMLPITHQVYSVWEWESTLWDNTHTNSHICSPSWSVCPGWMWPGANLSPVSYRSLKDTLETSV